MEIFTNQFPLEPLWGFLCWLAADLPIDICAAQPILISIAPFKTEITILVLSLIGLIVWVLVQVWMVGLAWRALFKPRHTTFDELLMEFRREQDKAQYDYLREILRGK